MNNKEDNINYPEHEPQIPFNYQLEQSKLDARRLASELRKKSSKYIPVITTKEGKVKTVNDLTFSEQEDEIIRCALNPIYFIEKYLTIFDQTKNDGNGEIIPFKLFDFQKDLIEIYLQNKFVIANKYRQAGVSTTTCAYIAWYIMFNENRQVAIVADKLETAKDELMSDVVNFIEDCPDWLKPKTGRQTEKNLKDTQKLKLYDNGSRLGAFSSKGLRGMTPTLIFWDETAWTEKGDIFWTSARPTLQTGGAAIMVSTPFGLDAVFYKTFMGAKRNENNFKAVELWWFNDPRYNKDLMWIKNKGKENEKQLIDENWDNKKRIMMMDDGWEATSPWFEEQIRDANGDMKKIAQELMCSFLGSGDNFIAEEYLKRIEENEIKPPIRQEYTDLNMWIWEDPIIGEDYLIGIDTSSGHGDDYSTINILKKQEIIEEKIITKNNKPQKIKIKKNKLVQVAEYYGKVKPQTLAEIAYQYAKRYNDGYCVIDITGGLGVQVVEKLLEFGYENIHYSEITHKPSRDRLQGYIKSAQKTLFDGRIVNIDLIPGFFIGNNRGSVLLELQRAIHLGDIKIQSIRLLSELKTFITVAGNRVADHKRTFHDDSIMGLAIGLYVLNFEMILFKQNNYNPEKMINAILTSNDVNEELMKNKYKNRISPNNPSSLNPYLVHSWLFTDLKK